MSQIRGIGLHTPGIPIKQGDLLELACAYNTTTRRDRVRLQRIYRGTSVDQRYSVLSGDAADSGAAVDRLRGFYSQPAGTRGPGTAARMSEYEARVAPLASRACVCALDRSEVRADQITHLVTVSCTGFAAPGLDACLIDALGLSRTVGRTHVGFMGCHGALNGLRVADALVAADPDAHVLLCCTELCTLHFQYGSDMQDAVANALFADGSAALVATGAAGTTPCPTTANFHTENLAATREMMAWRIGDHGFRMRLDSRVPDLLGRHLRPSIQAWLETRGLALDHIQGWAVHPGGPKIIDAVEDTLGLKHDATLASRIILRDFGNMSSPTVLFILDRMMRNEIPRPWVVLGFGPGLTIEAALIT